MVYTYKWTQILHALPEYIKL